MRPEPGIYQRQLYTVSNANGLTFAPAGNSQFIAKVSGHEISLWQFRV